MNQARTTENAETKVVQSQVIATLSERIQYHATKENRSVSAYIANLLETTVPKIPKSARKSHA